MDREGDALYFLREKVLLKGPMTGRVLAGYLSQTTEDIRETAGRNAEGVVNFVRHHRSIFTVHENGTIMLRSHEKTPETQAVNLLTEVLRDKGVMRIHKLVGHLGNAEEDVREAGGRNTEGLKKFILEHPTLFHMSGDCVNLTTRVFNDTLREIQSTDVHGAVLIVLKMFLKNCIYNASIDDVYSEVTDEEGPYEWDDLIDIVELREAICQWPFFEIDRSGIVTLKIEMLTNKRLLSLFICAALEAEENLTQQELLERILPYRITKMAGVDSPISLSGLLNSDRYLKVANYVSLADNSETQALRFVLDIISSSSKNTIHLQKITGHLSKASGEIRDILGGLSELRTFIENYPDVFCVSASEYVSLYEDEAAAIRGITLKGTVKELHSPSGTIIVTEGKLLGEEIYFNNSSCSFLKSGDDLTKHLEKGQCLSFEISRGKADGKFKWAAFNVSNASKFPSLQNGHGGNLPSKQSSIHTSEGTVKLLYSLYGTIIVTNGQHRGEEVYFNNNNCKFMGKGGDLMKHLQNGQSLSFQISEGVAGGKYKWAAFNVSTSSRGSPSKTADVDNAQGNQDKGTNTLQGTVKQLSKVYGTVTVTKGRHLIGEEVYFNNGHCEFMPKGSDLTKHVKKGQCLSFKVCKGYEGSKYKWVANRVCIIPQLPSSTESSAYPSSTNEELEHEFEIIKHVALLLLTQGDLAFSSLCLTLKEVIPAKAKELSSEGFLIGILSKYDIFELGKKTACLKVTPEEGNVSVIDVQYSVLRKTGTWERVLYHQSAVHIPPEAHMTNELDYQLKVNSSVKYIAVRIARSQPRPSLRAVLVWPSGGPNMNRLFAQLASPTVTHQVPPLNKNISTDKEQSKVSSSTGNTGSEGADMVNTHIELLKNVVLALLHNGKMTIKDLFKLSQQRMSRNLHLPNDSTDLQQLLAQYDLFRFEKHTVELRAEPIAGRISYILPNSTGFISNTPDSKDAFFKRYNIFVPPEGQSCSLTVNTNVLFFAVKVTSLPEKVQGNRIAPYRCVLVWPEGQALPVPVIQDQSVTSDNMEITKEDKSPILAEVIGCLVNSATDSSNASPDDLSFAVLREAMLLLLAAGPMGLAEMCKLLNGSSSLSACREIYKKTTLRQFLIRYDLFSFAGDTVGLSVVPKEGCISHVTGKNTGFIGEHQGQKDVAFDESAIHPENGCEVKAGMVVNYIPIDHPNCSDAKGRKDLKAVLLWSRDSSFQRRYNTKTTEGMTAFANILNTSLDLSFLVSLFLNILRCKDISRLTLAKCPSLPDLVSNILKDGILCRLYTLLHPSLLNLADDGMTLALVNVPSDVTSLRRQDAKIVSVSEESAAAECSDGKVFIARERFIHCQKGNVPIGKVAEDDMKSLVCAGDEVGCLAVHHLAPTSLPTLLQNPVVTWEAVLAWPASCNESLEVMFSGYRNIDSVLTKDINLCDQTSVYGSPIGDYHNKVACSGKVCLDPIPNQGIDPDTQLDKECLNDSEKAMEDRIEDLQLPDLRSCYEDQLLQDIPSDIQLRTVLTVFVECLETDGVLLQDLVNLLNSKSNAIGKTEKANYSADNLQPYLLRYRHMFEVRSGRIYLVGQYAPGDLVVKTSGDVYLEDSGHLHIRTDGTPCKNIKCHDTDIIHTGSGKPGVTVGDGVHLIVTSVDNSSSSWRVLLAWPDGVIQEFREGFLLLGQSRSHRTNDNSDKDAAVEQDCVLYTDPMTSNTKEKEVSESSQDIFAMPDIDGTQPYFCVPVFRVTTNTDVSESISLPKERFGSEQTSDVEGGATFARGNDEKTIPERQIALEEEVNLREASIPERELSPEKEVTQSQDTSMPIPELLSGITSKLESMMNNFAQLAKKAGEGASWEVHTKRVQEITEALGSLYKEQKDKIEDPVHTANQRSDSLPGMCKEPLEDLSSSEVKDISFSSWMNRRKGRCHQSLIRDPVLKMETCDKGCQTESDIFPAINATPNVPVINSASQTFSTGHIIPTHYH